MREGCDEPCGIARIARWELDAFLNDDLRGGRAGRAQQQEGEQRAEDKRSRMRAGRGSHAGRAGESEEPGNACAAVLLTGSISGQALSQ